MVRSTDFRRSAKSVSATSVLAVRGFECGIPYSDNARARAKIQGSLNPEMISLLTRTTADCKCNESNAIKQPVAPSA